MPYYYKQRGGMSSIGYKLAQNKIISGFGKKKYIQNPEAEFNKQEQEPNIDEFVIPKPKKGRPKKEQVNPSSLGVSNANTEDYYNYSPKYADKISDLLATALTHAKMQQYQIKRSQLDPLIASLEHKKYKKLEKLISTMLFNLSE